MEPAIASGQLDVAPARAAYAPQGHFNVERMLLTARDERDRALAEGYPALSLTGEMGWVDASLPGHERLAEYERRLAELLDTPLVTLCQYSAGGPLGPATLSDVAAAHEIDLSPELAALSRTGTLSGARSDEGRVLRLTGDLDFECADALAGPRRPLPRPAVPGPGGPRLRRRDRHGALRGHKGQRLMISGASAPSSACSGCSPGTPTPTSSSPSPERMSGLRHELLLYEDDERLADDATVFLAEGLEAGDAVVTVLEARKLGIVREALGPRADEVTWIDVAGHYTRPEAALADYDTSVRKLVGCGAPRVRLFGELPTLESEAQCDAWIAYDAILNRAFDHQPVSILCGYDGRVLPDRVLEAARRTHPRIRGGGPNADFGDPAEVVRAHTPAAQPLHGLRAFETGDGASGAPARADRGDARRGRAGRGHRRDGPRGERGARERAAVRGRSPGGPRRACRRRLRVRDHRRRPRLRRSARRLPAPRGRRRRPAAPGSGSPARAPLVSR